MAFERRPEFMKSLRDQKAIASMEKNEITDAKMAPKKKILVIRALRNLIPPNHISVLTSITRLPKPIITRNIPAVSDYFDAIG